MYKQKYLKYKNKYLNLKNELYFGGGLEDMPSQIITQILNKTTCKDVIKTAETNDSVANKINFSDLTNNIVLNQNININIRQNIACRRITDVARRNQCNEYYNKCYIKELFDKYCNIRYQGQILVAPAIYDVNTLNEILLRTIPNNTLDPNKVEDQQNLIRFGANIDHIDNSAFEACNLRSILIPNTITHIGMLAFHLNQLTEIIIPNTITNIEIMAFADNQLVKIIIPDSVNTIEMRSFHNNQLIDVTIPRIFRNRVQTIFGPNYGDIVFTYTD
jgi:hypothetical protein